MEKWLWFTVQGIVHCVREGMAARLGVAGHAMTTVRKQRKTEASSVFSLLFSLELSLWYAIYFQDGSSIVSQAYLEICSLNHPRGLL